MQAQRSLSLPEVMALLDPMKPLTTSVATDVLEFVGLNETMLLRISSLPDVNERLDCIRSMLKVIASGQDVAIAVVVQTPLLGAAEYLEFRLESNKPDITDQTRTR